MADMIEYQAETFDWDTGYVGSWLCGADRKFVDHPIITINFSKSYANVIPGITITWSSVYEEWSTNFKVTAYHGEQIVFETYARNSEVKAVVEGDIRGYDKIVIEVIEWSRPYRRARIEGLYIGIEKVYSKPDIMNYSATYSVDPLSAELPVNEITFELKNLNGEFNPDNPTGAEKYLMERQIVNTRYGYKLDDGIEWIDGGEFYLSEWETPQNGITATFTARNATELMTDTYTGKSSGTMLEVATEALEQAGLPVMDDGSKPWELDSNLGRINMPSGLDLSTYSISTVLQYIANATCCVLYQDRRGMFHMKQLVYNLTDYSIDRFNSYSNSEITLSKPLKSVNINNSDYIMTVGLTGETQPVNNPFISSEQAPAVAKWVADYLVNRRELTGNFRADPRLDPLDVVINENQFARSMILITEIQYTYNGAFRGSYQGRAIQSLSGAFYMSGEVFAGEVDA